MNIPLIDIHAQTQSCRAELNEAIAHVIDRTAFIMGTEVASLEKRLAAYTGSAYAVGCASGTDALILALRALDIGPGDEVITTPFTFFATAGAIVTVGAKPVFADIDLSTFNINADLIEEKITFRTRCIMPVHLFGQCADMEKIRSIAQKYSLTIIEDAAQSLGASFDNTMAGALGTLGCFSFYPTKNLGCMGDGGMIVTDSQHAADQAALLRVHGSSSEYTHTIVGTNSRLDTIQAAVLLVKMNYLDKWTEQRRLHAQRYGKDLANIDGCMLPVENQRCRHVYNQFTLLCQRRDELQAYLRGKGIGTRIYYPLPLHLQDSLAFLGHKKGAFPQSELAAHQALSIPVYPELTGIQQDYISRCIQEFYQ
ncbi:DegT/DnrJ/EryC1/StrS family aminotransferase [bacterium]|nr:DegT/DnrJ/EryC1/StrS family aminotransferase [bacterium]